MAEILSHHQRRFAFAMKSYLRAYALEQMRKGFEAMCNTDQERRKFARDFWQQLLLLKASNRHTIDLVLREQLEQKPRETAYG